MEPLPYKTLRKIGALFVLTPCINFAFLYILILRGVVDMAQTTLNVRIDEDVKNGLERFCHEVGLNISVAVNMFAKAVIREQRLPFDVALNTSNEETNKATDDVKHKRNLSRTFSSVAELMEELNAGD